jgi:NAD(P)-dependent dehydrogenase (short-subunit alcohol dehydrogenase family)
LKGQVALITGGGTGICNEIAWILGRHGAIVAIMGRRKGILDHACKAFSDENIEALAAEG